MVTVEARKLAGSATGKQQYKLCCSASDDRLLVYPENSGCVFLRAAFGVPQDQGLFTDRCNFYNVVVWRWLTAECVRLKPAAAPENPPASHDDSIFTPGWRSWASAPSYECATHMLVYFHVERRWPLLRFSFCTPAVFFTFNSNQTRASGNDVAPRLWRLGGAW